MTKEKTYLLSVSSQYIDSARCPACNAHLRVLINDKPLLDEALKALSELVILTEDTIDGNYDPDSFTCDPAKAVFNKVEVEYRKEHNLYPYSPMKSMGNFADNIERGR